MFGFRDDKIIFLFDNGSPLRVAENDPLETNILEVLSADFTCIGSEPIVRGILGSNFHIRVLESAQHSGDV